MKKNHIICTRKMLEDPVLKLGTREDFLLSTLSLNFVWESAVNEIR